MKLIKLEHEDKGLWYFTNISNAAKALGHRNPTNLEYHIYKHGHYKGWTVEQVEDYDVLGIYLNPETI